MFSTNIFQTFFQLFFKLKKIVIVWREINMFGLLIHEWCLSILFKIARVDTCDHLKVINRLFRACNSPWKKDKRYRRKKTDIEAEAHWTWSIIWWKVTGVEERARRQGVRVHIFYLHTPITCLRGRKTILWFRSCGKLPIIFVFLVSHKISINKLFISNITLHKKPICNKFDNFFLFCCDYCDNYCENIWSFFLVEKKMFYSV